MECFEKEHNAEQQSILCITCGEHVAIPNKLKDNVEKLKFECKTIWVICEEHHQPAEYY